MAVSACVETTNSKTKDGYGKTWVIRFGKRISRCHVRSWVEHNGKLPPKDKPYILHSCHNRACINPDHLRPGDQFDNMQDLKEAGNHPQWVRTHCKKGNHPLFGDNLYMAPNNGTRICRQCRKERQREKRSESRK